MARDAGTKPAESILVATGGHRGGVVTLLFTDIVGSAALKLQLGDRAGVDLLQQHHALVRRTLGQFAGAEEIVVAGDSLLILLLLRGHFSGIQKMQFSPDSRTLVTFADEKTARVWNVQTGRELLAPIDVSGPLLGHPYQGVFSEDDRFLLESDAKGKIRITPLPTLSEIDAIERAGSTDQISAKP